MKRKIVFEGSAFEDFNEWAKVDRKLYARIVELIKDVDRSPFSGLGKHSVVKAGDRAVVVDYLPATARQPEPGYTLEAFQQGETLDVVSVPISWVMLLPEVWGNTEASTIEAS